MPDDQNTHDNEQDSDGQSPPSINAEAHSEQHRNKAETKQQKSTEIMWLRIGLICRRIRDWLFRADSNHVIACATVVAAIAAIFYTCSAAQTLSVIRDQWRAMLEYNRLTRITADAAKSAADTSAKQLEIAERPWISASLSLGGPLVINKDGVRLIVVLSMNVSGHSPATQVRTEVVMFPVFLRHPDPVVKLMEVCKSAESNVPIPTFPKDMSQGTRWFSQTFFPGSQPQTATNIGISQSDIESVYAIAGGMGFDGGFQVPKGRPVEINVVGCVGYRTPLINTQYHTGVIMQLYRVDP